MSSPKKADGKKKRIVVIAVAAAIAAAVGVLYFTGAFKKPGVNANYVPPKLIGEFLPEEIIPLEEDEEYFSLDRDVHYEYAGVGTILTDGTQFSSGDCAKLFKKFFDALKAGDLAALKECYVEGYFDSNESPDSLTPQRAYDIRVSFYSSSEDVKFGDTVYDLENFKVVYKLRFNDLTFRSDTLSDVWKSQLFQIALVDGEYRIVNINQFFS
ncbi:MAG: hypothetical protein IJV00_03785 [Clostridia bacterium]|nr:hypothetical protein [Clostridia bacterium]